MQQCQQEVMTAAPASAAPIEPDVPAAGPSDGGQAAPPGRASRPGGYLPEAEGSGTPEGQIGDDPDRAWPRRVASTGEPDATRSDEAALWWAYRRTGEVSLRNRLVMLHGPWAEAQARRFARGRGFDWREVWGAAALGLIEAVERFDPAGGVPFRGYAVHRIQGALMDASRECYDHDFVVRSFGAATDGAAASASELQAPGEPPPPVDHTSQEVPDIAMHRSVESRVLGCMPDERSREITRRRFCLLQSVDEIAYYMAVEKSRVEEIMRDVVLPRARRLCIKLGIRPRRRGLTCDLSASHGGEKQP